MCFNLLVRVCITASPGVAASACAAATAAAAAVAIDTAATAASAAEEPQQRCNATGAPATGWVQTS